MVENESVSFDFIHIVFTRTPLCGFQDEFDMWHVRLTVLRYFA